MADRSAQQRIGGESSGQGQSSGDAAALNRGLAELLGIEIGRLQTAGDARDHVEAARARTNDQLATRQDELDTVNQARWQGAEEQEALFEMLEELRQTQDNQLTEYFRLVDEEQLAYSNIDDQQQASVSLMDRLSARRDALFAQEDELERLYDSIDERWMQVGDTLASLGIALGEAGATRDLEGLTTLIDGHRGALDRSLADLERRTIEAKEQEQAAKTRTEQATARLQALQEEIGTLRATPEDPQDQGQTAAIAERLEALEAERFEVDAGIRAGTEELGQIETRLEDLERQKSKVSGDIGVLNGLLNDGKSTINELRSVDGQYKLALQRSIKINDEINEIENDIMENDDNVRSINENIEGLKNKIAHTQLSISDVENKIEIERSKIDSVDQKIDGLDQQKIALEEKVDELLAIASRLDSPALLRAIEQLPESLRGDTIGDDAAGPSRPTTQPQTGQQEDIGLAPASDLTSHPAGDDGVGALPQAFQQLVVANGGDQVASASMLSAIRDVGKVVLRDLAVLLTLATTREAAAYGISAGSEKMKQDLAPILIALNFLPIAVKIGGMVYDSSSSRPAENRLAPTGKQYASVATNTLLMIGATAAAAQAGGGIAAQGPASARALIIGLRDMVNMYFPVTDNRNGGPLLNMAAVLADNVAYSTYSQLTTVLIALGLVHSGAGAQAAGLAGREAAGEVAKYVAAYTAVELLETISYRAFNQYFDRIAMGLEPPMPGDPNARQGLQGIARYRAKVGFKLRHTLGEIRRQGTDAAHARQAFTYILLIFGNVVSELTRNQTVAASTLISAGAFFAATFVAYFPFVGIGEYAARQG
ncbi:hypothetical protein [Inquilinus sp. Marseille-Q2685]|uniref:hypothetical protein n=1 Tax=Inquilinus sp. Marseille-Q2685 TaxID=2866581 RepID=UPI001CE41945|nr:hypothetical protein [Inquilinus sp. Marseille-Q2685]